ncbi:GDP-mannose 4,6-dehydratase, partial [Celeribacter halophilus]
GTFELLEAARAYPPKHMLLASTSSAYGANTDMPYQETVKADHQMSFYAATKKSTENMAHSYAHLFDLPITMFRFFTVYGPWGRPDMALFKFTKAILEDKPIDVYNYGDMKRDFTYVEDLVHAIRLLIDAVPVRPENGEVEEGDSLSPVAPYRVVNIGNNDAVQLVDFIEAIENATGKKTERNLMPMQAGDVPATWADASLLKRLTGYAPQTAVPEGVASFVRWYRQYYNA